MLENLIKQATCIIRCGFEQGTGQLVTSTAVLTARHCIATSIDSETPILVTFSKDGKLQEISATVMADSPEFDTALLLLAEQVDIAPLPLRAKLPSEGSIWVSYGYPASKATIGHRLSGTISQILPAPRLKMDLDLAIDPSVALSAYEGMSGAGLFDNGVCKGLVRLGVEQGVGAISILQLKDFLTSNSIPVEPADGEQDATQVKKTLAQRIDFEKDFEAMLLAKPGSYIFLEGAHGIGKTTFCTSFAPDSNRITVLGTYSLTSGIDGLGPAQRAQPEVFTRWFETLVLELLTGKPGRLGERSYTQLIETCSSMLQEFATHCVQNSQHGVIFVDGLNEAQAAGVDALTRLIGLLPMNLPSGISIVLTAPNFDIVASILAGRVRSDAVLALPVLTDEAARQYCASHPGLKDAPSSLVASICTKAKGHPLYLRYVIEFVQGSDQPDALDEFPEFSGIIEDYYEILWSRLQPDSDAVALLAIMARLRFGISLNEFAHILTAQEKGVFVSVISRIKHLLLRPTDSSIYHPSFANFLALKTAAIEEATHERLGAFCGLHDEKRYCTINLVYHLLRSTEAHRALGISSCTQEWVDRCVTFGAEADTLLYDVDEVIAEAADSANAVEMIRVLLLSQRMRFRYNVLFTQSAGEVAEALIALDRPEDAFNHIVRFGALVCPTDIALKLAYELIQRKYKPLALRLLTLINDKIQEGYEHEQTDVAYFNLVALGLRCLYLMHKADGRVRHKELQLTLTQATVAIKHMYGAQDSTQSQLALADVLASLFSTIIVLGGQYNSLLKTFKAFGSTPENVLDILSITLLKVADLSREYRIPLKTCCPTTIFKELDFLLDKGMTSSNDHLLNVLDVLIQCGAPVELIDKFAKSLPQQYKSETALVKKDGVSVDFAGCYRMMRQERVASFLTPNDDCPEVRPFTATTWVDTLEQLVRALAWCEGSARRSVMMDDADKVQLVLDLLKKRVLRSLELPLMERIGWEHSYLIPEELVPLLYERIIEVYAVCFPNELEELLEALCARLPGQLGIYSEGFRRILDSVIDTVSVQGASEKAMDSAFSILKYWKNFVIRNVKNRHELIPELLKMIPALVRYDASEPANTVYQQMLSVSMGPSWYKEDQLGLMNSALEIVQPSSSLAASLPEIAGYLEAASGEMTFQRFVRYDKSKFLKELFKKGYSLSGVRYFKRQTCGNESELLTEASQGDMDRAGPFAGGRYPGNALDEQASMFDIVSGAESADWRLRWALLEIYMYGDARHIHTYAKELAGMINSLELGSELLSNALTRLQLVISAEVPQSEQSVFLNSFTEALSLSHSEAASDALAQLGLAIAPKEMSTRAHVKPRSVEDTEESTSSKKDRDFSIPGLIGPTSAYRTAADLLKQADSQLDRGNEKKARDLAIQALRGVQESGGSIWGARGDSNIKRAEQILTTNANHAGELIARYGSLILGESHVERWRIAEHLIDAITAMASPDESMKILRCAIEHVSLMVGDADVQISDYDFLSREENQDVSDVLFDLLVWLIDHPTKLRREKAADVLAWVIKGSEKYLQKCIEAAFAMTYGFAADVLCEIMDEVSETDPIGFWGSLTSVIDLSDELGKLRHVGRLSALLTIAHRASKLGSVSAEDLLKKVQSALIGGATSSVRSENVLLTLPAWATSVSEPWRKLKAMGVIDVSTLDRFVVEMERLCAPLDVQTAGQLEIQVLKSFKASELDRLNRWESKVRFALNVAVLANVTSANIKSVAAVLSVTNPSDLAATRKATLQSRAPAILEGLARQSSQAVSGYEDECYLHYLEVLEFRGRPLTIEITAVMTSNYNGGRAEFPSEKSLFDSVELPPSEVALSTHDTCYRVRPTAAFLGSFTPAYPQPAFAKLTGATDKDFSRENWRIGKRHTHDLIGIPMYEGSMLTVKRSVLQRLRPSWGIAWVVFVNGQHAATTHSKT